MRHKLDNRIRTLIENGVATGHRTLFAIVGDKGRDQIPILYHILTRASVAARPSVLWCYKENLVFSTNRKKRMKELKRNQSVSNTTYNDNNPFESFVSSTHIRKCYYNETDTILGNTYGVLVLQDFEALTPNLLARTIETVEGGGLVIFLLKSVSSLRQLYTMSMDVHNRYRTEANSQIVPRFNERFILSLASSPSIAVMDDQLNVLPISSHISTVEPISGIKKSLSASEDELKTMKEAMKDAKPIGSLLAKCKTSCQGKSLLRLLDVITEKTLNATCSLTAARGRGKSASLGLALAGAVAFGYTNIFVTSPSPENLRTLFEFVMKGFDAIEYQEHTDYELIQSTNSEYNKAIVRVNVFREHRQTIQYIHPTDAVKLGQAELVVVDEAAAIPLPLVKELISGPYLVFLASTINGYEGTGRSLSLKLLQQLREQSAGSAKGENAVLSKGRVLHEMSLDESIRYKPGDMIEQWLNRVLCLDACSNSTCLSCGTPPPSECELFYVNRDTLFSFHKASEMFLQQLMGIFVAAHYKNTPNDLQMLSDAPAHHLFVLMAPVEKDQTSLPEALVVIQVCLEGNISRGFASSSLNSGKLPDGDLLSWTVSQQFLDKDFPTLSGARVARIAVHPDYQDMGYGSKALSLLEEYYLGQMTSLDENIPKENIKVVKNSDTVALLEEQISPRTDLPPLLLRLTERPAERLDYLGVSFGLTFNLLKFWKKSAYVPVYLKQTANDLTGEYTCIMLKHLATDDGSKHTWLAAYWSEFRRRLIQLLAYEFASFPVELAMSLLQLKNKDIESDETKNREVLTRQELSLFLTNSDLKRLEEYSKSRIDHHLITDIMPTIAKLYFEQRLPEYVKLAPPQAAVFLGRGLQRKTMEKIASELSLPTKQVFSFYIKSMRKLSGCLDSICTESIKSVINATEPEQGVVVNNFKSLSKTVEEDLQEAAMEIRERQERDKKAVVAELSREMKQYEITADQKDLEEAYSSANMKFTQPLNNTISVQRKRPPSKADIPDEKDPHAKRKMKAKNQHKH